MATRWKSEKVTITPALAQTYLDANADNRDIRTRTVNRYARLMKRGKWKLTHQGIGFDENGRLVDGQHRLRAIVVADVPVEMMVTTGLDPETFRDVDTGVRRNDVDRLKFAGHSDVQLRSAACCRAMLHAAAGLLAQRGRVRLADVFEEGDYLDYYEKHHKAIEFAMCEMKTTRGLYNGQFLAAVARAYYTVDRDRLQQFLRVYTTGMSETLKDSVAIRLRNNAINTGMEKKRSGGEFYFKTETAIKLFMDGKDTDRLYAASEELFPVPGDNKVKKLVEERLLQLDADRAKPEAELAAV